MLIFVKPLLPFFLPFNHFSICSPSFTEPGNMCQALYLASCCTQGPASLPGDHLSGPSTGTEVLAPHPQPRGQHLGGCRPGVPHLPLTILSLQRPGCLQGPTAPHCLAPLQACFVGRTEKKGHENGAGSREGVSRKGAEMRK